MLTLVFYLSLVAFFMKQKKVKITMMIVSIILAVLDVAACVVDSSYAMCVIRSVYMINPVYLILKMIVLQLSNLFRIMGYFYFVIVPEILCAIIEIVLAVLAMKLTFCFVKNDNGKTRMCVIKDSEKKDAGGIDGKVTLENDAKRDEGTIPAELKPISMWGYFGYEILFSIPLIGWIVLIVKAISAKNTNVKNFARSYFCLLIIAVVIALIAFMVFSSRRSF